MSPQRRLISLFLTTTKSSCNSILRLQHILQSRHDLIPIREDQSPRILLYKGLERSPVNLKNMINILTSFAATQSPIEFQFGRSFRYPEHHQGDVPWPQTKFRSLYYDLLSNEYDLLRKSLSSKLADILTHRAPSFRRGNSQPLPLFHPMWMDTRKLDVRPRILIASCRGEATSLDTLEEMK